jgi:hypothetical protein
MRFRESLLEREQRKKKRLGSSGSRGPTLKSSRPKSALGHHFPQTAALKNNSLSEASTSSARVERIEQTIFVAVDT